ncbi:MAG: DUF4169 family protein [Pseudomonadota bacterium]|uniref:DUF4169 family protein n=1 Tax=Sphingomonas sp. ERG5 TaxID=1381597 RepID=UPI00054B7D66|nr:DUF4169 family protein [Sphingomonas sp. ERG5]
MADIVNLRTVRKARARAAATAQADSNRAASGRTRAEKHATEREAKMLNDKLDGSKLVKD